MTKVVIYTKWWYKVVNQSVETKSRKNGITLEKKIWETSRWHTLMKQSDASKWCHKLKAQCDDTNWWYKVMIYVNRKVMTQSHNTKW